MDGAISYCVHDERQRRLVIANPGRVLERLVWRFRVRPVKRNQRPNCAVELPPPTFHVEVGPQLVGVLPAERPNRIICQLGIEPLERDGCRCTLHGSARIPVPGP
jgi:hypothetical protein